MKKLFLLSAVLRGFVTASSHAGVRFSLGLPLPPLPLPGIEFRAAPPVYAAPPSAYYDAPCYDAPVVVGPPSVYFDFGSPGYHRYGGYGHYRGYDHYRGYEHYRGGYDHYRGHYSYRYHGHDRGHRW